MAEVDISGGPTIAVIMPVFNAERLLPRCLAPLREMLARGEIHQILTVDDCSTDDGPALLETIPELFRLRTPHNMGPGGARNVAAGTATCDYLWFVDSDVIVAPDAAQVLAAALKGDRYAAVFGSYDHEPESRTFLSQYKNLVHRYYHQRAKSEASTFWAGCGAVNRQLFIKLGGFDVARFPYPSIEDIELGYRITDAGGRILFEPALQSKHLKVWRLGNLLHTEIFRRAIPWSLLMLGRGKVTDDLNVGTAERVRAVIAGLLVLTLAGWTLGLLGVWWLAGAAVAAIWANRHFISFFYRLRGAWFALRAFLFHQLYYLYSGAAFTYATLIHKLGANR
jgi:GT2 family glycosyltransferase